MASAFARTVSVVTLLVGAARAGQADVCIDASESGQVERDKGHFQAAKKHFQMCARDGCPGEIRKDCATWLDALDRRIPSVVVRVTDDAGREVLDAKITIDGVPVASGGIAVSLDPGEKTVRAERAGRPAVEQTIRVVEGERARLVELQLRDATAKPAATDTAPPPVPHTSKTIPTATYALGGVALLAAGGYAFFGLRAKGDVDDMRSTCAPACDASRVDAAKRDRNLANVLFGVSALSLGGALYFALGDTGSSAGRARGVAFVGGPNGAAAAFVSRF